MRYERTPKDVCEEAIRHLYFVQLFFIAAKSGIIVGLETLASWRKSALHTLFKWIGSTLESREFRKCYFP